MFSTIGPVRKSAQGRVGRDHEVAFVSQTFSKRLVVLAGTENSMPNDDCVVTWSAPSQVMEGRSSDFNEIRMGQCNLLFQYKWVRRNIACRGLSVLTTEGVFAQI